LAEKGAIGGSFESSLVVHDRLFMVEITKLRKPELQLRQTDEKIVEELVNSIERQGLLQPILVRPVASQEYEIVFGVHRVEAYQRLGRATIPAIVKSLSDEASFLARVGENLTRNILVDPISEAKGYISLIDRGWTISAIAQQIGKSDSYVSDRVGLIRRLDPSIVSRVVQGSRKLSSTHAVLLARVKDRSRQLELAEFVEMKNLSVRELEHLIRDRLPITFDVTLSRVADQIALPDRLLRTLGMTPGERACVRFKGRKIIIESISIQTQTPQTASQSQADSCPASL
jgi:ParB/RepB/Spo0J family partition protein